MNISASTTLHQRNRSGQLNPNPEAVMPLLRSSTTVLNANNTTTSTGFQPKSATPKVSLDTAFHEQLANLIRQRNEARPADQAGEDMNVSSKGVETTTASLMNSRNSLDGESNIVETLNHKIDELSRTLEQTSSKITEKEHEISSLKTHLEGIVNIKEDLEKETTTSEGLRAQLKAIEQEKEELVRKQESVEKELHEAHNFFNETLQELKDKLKYVEEKSLKDLDASRGEFLSRIDDLEREKLELSKAAAEARDDLDKARNDLDLSRGELAHTHDNFESERRHLIEKIDESENHARTNQIRAEAAETEIARLKSQVEQEKELLQDELDESRAKAEKAATIANNENRELKKTVLELEKNNEELQKQALKAEEELEAARKEISGLKMYKEQQLLKEEEALENKRLVESFSEERQELHRKIEELQEALNMRAEEFQETIDAKNQYIDALIFDVNQMKEFIEDNHGKAVFEEEKEKEREKESAKIILAEDKFINEEPVEKVKAVQITEEVKEKAPEQKAPRTSKGGQEKKKSEKRVASEKEVASQKSETGGKTAEGTRDKNTRAAEFIYKHLENIIKELNEKLMNTEKKTQRLVEERVASIAKAQSEKEELLAVELQKMKDEKKELLKKIDDMEWNYSYKYTETMKAQKEAEERAKEAALKLVEAKKKKNNTAPKKK